MGRTLCCVLVVLLVTGGGVIGPALAVEGNPEQTLQSTAGLARKAVGRMLDERSSDRIATGDIKLLQGLHESLYASHLLMTERLHLRGDALQGTAGEGLERHRVMVGRYEAVMTRLLELAGRLSTLPVADSPLLKDLRAALDDLAPPQRQPIHGILPYCQPEFSPRLPAVSPSLLPVYRMAVLQPSVAADLAGSPEAPVSALIARQAGAIAAESGRTHWDPAAIYDWVRQNIRTEWYWGSMKGAEETLRQRCGNDADQAALLIALLRAAGYPARYVRGAIEFFPGLDAARAATGIDDPEQLLAFFQMAGIPCEPVREGSSIVNIRIEHLWVETLVPYANYRGLVADTNGRLWVPLDTSIKTGEVSTDSAIDLLSMPGNPLPGFRDRYLAIDQTETPLSMLHQETDLFLAASQPGKSFADTLHASSRRLTPLGILPGALQFVEVAVTAEYTALPGELQHHIGLRASGNDPAEPPLFDVTLPVRQLSNRLVMIGFEPETVTDQEQINLWGGLDNTPAYLVRLRPVLVVDGERLAVGGTGLEAGGEFSLTVEFLGPNGRTSVSDSARSGYPLVLGVVAQEALPPIKETLPATAADRLSRAALAYVEEWNRTEREFAELLDLTLARPLPTLVAVGGMLRVDELAGAPHAVTWQGLFIDADLRRAAAIPRAGAAPERVRTFFELSALEGAVQEYRLFEQEFGVTGISTPRLFGLAQAGGVPLVTIEAGNVTTVLPTLPLPVNVADDIAATVAEGLTVTVPERELALHDWMGIGYRMENPVTGEAGYMLSGGLAGGQTVLGRRDWPEEIASIMARPFSGPPDNDPAQAFSLAGVTPPEVRLATAGVELTGTLMALVRSAGGLPVAGAPVTFTVRTGGGWLVDDELAPGIRLGELTAVSGDDGIAHARFVPGESTAAHPVVYVREGDRHANIVGENLIDARLGSGSLAQLATPLAIFGFAGLPDATLSRAYGDNLHGEVFGYSGDTLLLLRDRFGNPVANLAVVFSAQPVQPAINSSCQDPPGLTPEQRDAQLVADEGCLQRSPVHGECSAAASISVVSRSDGGARAGVILGGVPYARYPVSAVFTADGGPVTTTWHHQSEPFASCGIVGAAPETRLVVSYQERLDEAGRNVDARPAGEVADLLLKAYLLAEGETLLPGGQALDCSPLPVRSCNTIAGTGAFTLARPARVTIAGQPAGQAAMTGSQVLPYLYRGTVALPLGLNEVPVEATADISRRQIVNSCITCGTEQTVALAIGPESQSLPIWGVDVQLPGAVTVTVNSRGIVQSDLFFGYTIRPAQYAANYAQVLLYRNNELWDTLSGGTSGDAAVTFPAGYWFDPGANYELQVILNNPGDANEIRSRRIPLLRRTTAVELHIDGLPEAVADQVGAFVLLNNDFDEKDADPAVLLPDAATPEIVETDDELKRAWLQIDDSSGAGGSWQVRSSDPARLRIYHQKDGQWVEFKPTDSPEPVAGFPAIIPLYLEGLAESDALRSDTLIATFLPAGGATVCAALPVTTMKLDMAVDGNRNRKIMFDESGDESALFWVNNDHDVQGTEDGQPVEDDAETGDDSIDARISCKRDLEDFARLHILLGTLGAPGPLTYTLRMAADDDKIQPMVNVFPAVNLSDGYLGLPSDQATPEQPDEQRVKPLLAAVGQQPVTLSAGSLMVTGGNPFLFEGRMPGKGRLVLTANHLGVPVTTRSVALELVDPTWFYDHFVVSPATDGEIATVRESVNPEGMAADASRLGFYRPATDEYVLYVHGWNMQPWEKRRWTETIFKRLWWQGYQGKVGLFDWPCRTMPSWDFLANFDKSEFLAWNSAEALAGVLRELHVRHPGQVRLLAHSQGNVVAGEALRLAEEKLVHTYTASQAALSAGYFGKGLPPLADFIPKTPDVIMSYPDDPARQSYLSGISGKAAKVLSYFNVVDYALTGDSVLQPTWLLNNRTKPDNSLSYGYQGSVDDYSPTDSTIGFYRSIIIDGGEPGSFYLSQRVFPQDSYEIYSFCAQSRTCALGSSNVLPEGVAGSVDLSSIGYGRDKNSHSRQFRSNIVDEQQYWRQFVMDAALSR